MDVALRCARAASHASPKSTSVPAENLFARLLDRKRNQLLILELYQNHGFTNISDGDCSRGESGRRSHAGGCRSGGGSARDEETEARSGAGRGEETEPPHVWIAAGNAQQSQGGGGEAVWHDEAATGARGAFEQETEWGEGYFGGEASARLRGEAVA